MPSPLLLPPLILLAAPEAFPLLTVVAVGGVAALVVLAVLAWLAIAPWSLWRSLVPSLPLPGWWSLRPSPLAGSAGLTGPGLAGLTLGLALALALTEAGGIKRSFKRC